jgi:uncharacterized protein with HXXEE motif
MSPRSKLLFLLLVIVQAAHSVEEYLTRLFEVFAPARFVSGLVSDELALGFAVVNAVFFGIGAWCYVGPVRAGGVAGQVAAAAWIVIELANGISHIGIAAASGAYFSGSVTAVLLLVTAVCLAFSLLADRKRGVPVAGGVA